MKNAHPSLSLSVLATHLDAELRGDPEVRISGVAGIETAGPHELTFVANPRYTSLARSTTAGAIVVDRGFADISTPTLRVDNPYLAFARAIELFHSTPSYPPGIHATAVIDSTAEIGVGAHIGPYAVIMAGVVLGDHATVLSHVVLYTEVHIGHHFFAHAHAVVREGCRLGDYIVLQNGAIIGADGFGYARQADATWYKIQQTGCAVLEDSVEVQANACVDRASIGETRIRSGSKIDNLVQVGHGSTVGANTLLCAQSGLAGSTVVGDRVILAGQVGVAGHCTIGDDVVATAQSGIPGDVAPGQIVSGYPAIENRKWLRSVSLFNRFPDILRTLKVRTKVT